MAADREVRLYMSPTALDLARRLVACPEWRWVRGMAAMAPESGHHWRRDHRGAWMCEAKVNGLCLGGWVATLPPWEMVPDLTDAATAGVLLAQLSRYSVAPVIGSPTAYAVSTGAGTWSGATLGEAVARALLETWEAHRGY